MLVWDEAEYASIGRSLARGEGYRVGDQVEYLRPPVLPFSIAASLLAFGENGDAIAKLPSVAYTLLLVAAVYAFLLRDGGRVAALAGAVAVAVSPELAVCGVRLLSEMPFMVFYSTAVLAFAFGFERHPRWFYVSWLAFALALSTRYTALLFAPTVAIAIGFELMRDRRHALALLRSRRFLVAPFVAALPLLTPWYLRQWLGTGDPLSGIRYASNQIPSYVSASMPWHFYLSALPKALTWPILAVGVAGLLHALATRRRLGVYSAAAAFVVIAWHSQYDYKEVRLMLPALPFFAVGVGFATAAWRTGRASAWERRALPATLLAAAALLGYRDIHATLEGEIALGEPSFLNAMEYVRNRLPADDALIAAAFPQTNWYADRPTRRTPPTVDLLLEELDSVEWVVITNFERSEPDYLRAIYEDLRWSDRFREEVQIFATSPFQTVLARSDWVRRKLRPAASGER